MDPFEDIFSEDSVADATVNKFQPKAKPRPKKAAPRKSVPSTIRGDSKKPFVTQASNELHAGQGVQLLDVVDKRPEGPVPPNLALEDTFRTEMLLERDRDTSLGSRVDDGNKDSHPSYVTQASNELHAEQDVILVDVADKRPEDLVPTYSALEDTSMTEMLLERDRDTSLGSSVDDGNKNSHPSYVTQASNESHARQDVLLVDVPDKRPESPVRPDSALEDTSRTEMPLKRDKGTSLGSPVNDGNKSSDPNYFSSEHGDSFMRAEVLYFDEKAADICSHSELGSFDKIIYSSTSSTDNLHNQIGVDDHPAGKSSIPVHNDGQGCSFLPLETQTSNICGGIDSQTTPHVHVSPDYLSEPRYCDASEAQTSDTDFMAQDQRIYSGDAIYNQNRESEVETQKSQIELPEIVDADFRINDVIPGITESCVQKYQPRPKPQNRKPKVSFEIPDTFPTVMLPPAPATQSAGSRQIDDGSIHADKHYGGSVPRDYSCEELTNPEEISPSEVLFSDDRPPSLALPKQNSKRRKRSLKNSDHSQEPIESSLPSEGNYSDKLRRQKKNSVPAFSPDADLEERACYSGGSTDEYVAYSIGNEDENGKDEDKYKGDTTSKKKRAPRKGNKTKDNGSPSQKRSKSSIAPKRFPHATKRKRRCVDKTLLEIPEDEIDYRNLRIKDLIILAEIRERLANKASTSDTPQTNESVDNPVHSEDLAYENDYYAEQDDDLADNEDPVKTQQGPSLFNYHSYMNRPRSARWSKQETELFYQGVSQFGSDLSMIKQLFPDRDRNQVKQKYKFEERKNRSRLHDALAGRSKDYTHFKKVIEQLQLGTAQADKDANSDHSMGMSAEDAEVQELVPEANAEASNTKQGEELVVENDVPNVDSHSEADADDDDMWGNYQSLC